MESETEELARRVVEALSDAGLMLATAESCTGGLIAGAITGIAGSSAVFDRGFVTYSNAAKREMIGVDESLLERHGAVSEAVARAMAEGALRASAAGIAVSVTGIAGPGGGSAEKPVGLVHFACAMRGTTLHVEKRYGDLGRAAVRGASVRTALQLVLDRLADRQVIR
ncbi:CinA family protein [Aurantimonas sp. Leaf443]|uniref:CinA family protein n=1 Tax=Aurantimonas sp. Leaf443 TaxID=1736378 RepID=UPI0006F282DC|nr:CinA family protein [Aurantimonas sp. Leaf443]KQT83471.1 damage-inducible protein CinA [Aurantimonas sp. Leaf443]